MELVFMKSTPKYENLDVKLNHITTILSCRPSISMLMKNVAKYSLKERDLLTPPTTPIRVGEGKNPMSISTLDDPNN